MHINITSCETGVREQTLVSHGDWITSLAFNPVNQSYFATASLDGTVRLWNKGVQKEVKVFELGEGGVWSVSFSPDGNNMAIAC
mmetsp:Transcript_42361/g.65010  ORF Transcript_42361/g.65010 Transcript_42361/m.65010 type:complete len:84 (+) Transcript_42361:711-962(+)